jgi:hypothetical protein
VSFNSTSQNKKNYLSSSSNVLKKSGLLPTLEETEPDFQLQPEFQTDSDDSENTPGFEHRRESYFDPLNVQSMKRTISKIYFLFK